MKKFRFDPLKTTPLLPSQQPPPKKQQKTAKISKEERDKEAKKSALEKQIQNLNQKIGSTANNIGETKKLLNIDLFLKKQKQKRLEYAKKLNEEYQHDKKERERKVYKTNTQNDKSQKLTNTAFKSQVPLSIFGAVDQIQKSDQRMKNWILDGHHHQLDQILLDKSKNQLFGENMTKAEEECLKNNNQNAWKRVKEVTTNSAQMTCFPVTIEQNQLQPSDSCQTLMSVLTLMPPQLSQHLFSQHNDVNRQKYFMVKFFAGGQRKSILTDQWIQVRQFVHKLVNVNSRFKNNLVFWSTIIEKAFKKLFFKQYQSFSLPQMFSNVYGLDPQLIPFTNKNILRENLPKILHTLQNQQPKALIGFINDRSDTPTRIYPLLQVIFPPPPLKNKKKKKSKEEQAPVITDIFYHISNPYSGTILSSTFVNKFTITQLYQKFNKIVILRELPSKWGGIRVFVQFLSNGPISFTGSGWTQNNQYSFTLNKTSNIRLALRRRWGSYIDPQKKQQDNIYGFMLLKTPNGQTEVSCLKLQNLIHKGKSTDECSCTFDCLLQKGTYVLIPYSHTVSQQYMQLFNLDLLAQKQQIISINKSKLNDYFYHNQQTNNDKTLQKLQSKIKHQKPRWEKIIVPKLYLNSDNKPDINVGDVQSMGLTLMKNASCQDYFVPGGLKKLLSNGQVKQQKKEKINKRSAQNEQIQQYQKEQALKTLLGYDILMGQDINHGQMKNIIEQTADQVDLAHFNLGQQGLMAMIEPILQIPRIVTLDLSHNNLNDSAITYLCYYLEKGNRIQLKEINLTGNHGIGRNGIKALKGLSNSLKEVKIIGVKL